MRAGPAFRARISDLHVIHHGGNAVELLELGRPLYSNYSTSGNSGFWSGFISSQAAQRAWGLVVNARTRGNGVPKSGYPSCVHVNGLACTSRSAHPSTREDFE